MPFLAGFVVRLSGRQVLADAVALPPAEAAAKIPPAVWADVVTRACLPNYRTTYTTSPGDATQSLTAPRLGVHILSDANFGFAVVSDEATPRRNAHYVLDEMSKLFFKMFVEDPASLTPAMCDAYKPQLLSMLTKYSDERNIDDKVKKIRAAVDEVKDLALDNIERVLERGSKIDDIVAQTDTLQSQAANFQRNSRQLRVQMWWNNVRSTALIVGAVVVFLIIVYFLFCGGIRCNPTGKTETAPSDKTA